MYKFISSIVLFAGVLGAQVEVVQLAPQDSGTPRFLSFATAPVGSCRVEPTWG